MTEILTESFCERCGTRYTFESAAPKQKRLGGIKTIGRGLKNFVLSDDSSLDEAMAAARSDTDREATAQQLDAFHRTFNFCMSCRQYTCGNCWNQVEARCLSCAPIAGAELLEAPMATPDLEQLLRLTTTPSEAAISVDPHIHEMLVGEAEAAAHLHSGDEILPEPEPSAAGLDLGAAEPEVAPELEVAAESEVEGIEVQELEVPEDAVAEAPIAAEAKAPEAEAPQAPDHFDPDAAFAEMRREAAEAAEREFAEAGPLEAVDLAAEAEAGAAEPEAEASAGPEPWAVTAEPEAVAASEPEAVAAKPAAAPDDGLAAAYFDAAAAAAADARAAEEADEAVDGVAGLEPGANLDDAIAAYEAALDDAAPAVRPEIDVVEQPTWPVAPVAAPAEPEPEPIAAQVAEEAVEEVAPEPVAAADVAPEITAPEIPAPPPAAPIAPASAEVPSTTPPQWPTGPRWPTAMPARQTTPPPPPAPQMDPLQAIMARQATEAMWAASSRDVVQPPLMPQAPAPIAGVQPCVSCGISLSANARFCRRCGTSQVG